MMVLFFALLVVTVAAAQSTTMPLPWSRELIVLNPPLQGKDVEITQYLLLRDPSTAKTLQSGVYDAGTASAVQDFQKAHDLSPTGVVDSRTAQLLLDLCSADGVKDSGFTAESLGFKYKLHIPVHVNRSIETKATLFDSRNNVMHVFTIRAHGHRDNDQGTEDWPDFGNGDIGLTQFAGNGDTTTGIIEIDLNTPEPSAALYGPWPINRFVRGLSGNAKFLLPNYRDGQLLHTGDWSTPEKPWDTSMPMPNSEGCLHAHPEDVERVFKILTEKLGVVANPNPFSGKNYPYPPQGIAVVELFNN